MCPSLKDNIKKKEREREMDTVLLSSTTFKVKHRDIWVQSLFKAWRVRVEE